MGRKDNGNRGMDLNAVSEYTTLNRARINEDLNNAIEYNKMLYLFAPIAWGKTTTLKKYINTCKHNAKWFDLKDKLFSMNNLSTLSDNLKTIIILDNFQEIEGSELGNKLVEFIKISPNGYKFIIIGRNKPAAYFSEFIVKGQIKILTVENLSFTEIEIKEFYLENKLDLNSSEIKKIYDYTEGWPAITVIILVLLKLDYSLLDLVNKTNEFIENFIEENIWDKWNEKHKNFFMRISLLNILPISLCAELSKEYKEINILEHFSINKLNNSYKMNLALRNFLKNKIKIHMSNEVSEIYESMGWWFEKNNYEIEAIDLYFKANKITNILKLLEKNYYKHIKISNINEVGKYLKKIIDQVDSYSPVICGLMAIYEIINSKAGNGEIWYEKLVKVYETLAPKSEEKMNLLLKIIYIKANMKNTNYKEMIKFHSDLLNKLPKEQFPIQKLTLTEGLPSMVRGIKDYSKVGRHYNLIKKILSPKIKMIYGNCGLRLLEVIGAELEYGKNNLNSSLIILTKQLYQIKNDPIDMIFTIKIIMEKVIRATGDIDKCEDVMYKLKIDILNNKAFYLLKNYNSVSARLALLKGDVKGAQELIMDYTEDENESITCLEMHQYLTKVRVYIAMGKYQRAIMLLQRLYEINIKYDYILNVIECHILEAISLFKSEDKELALERIYRALKLAQPYSYIRIFADEGESCYVILNQYAKSKHKDINEEYLKNILIETRTFAQLYPKYLEKNVEINDLKLTKTEIEIINLLNRGMSNSNISEYLNIKVATVKFHTKNIYAKLGVKSRLSAVQIAKNKNIIE